MENLFIESSRNKDRFPSSQGLLTIEDLWDLPLETTDPRRTSLESIGSIFSIEITKRSSAFSIRERVNANETLERKFDIIKYIIDVKLEEQKAKEKETTNKNRISELTEILADQQADKDKNRSAKDIQKEIKALSN